VTWNENLKRCQEEAIKFIDKGEPWVAFTFILAIIGHEDFNLFAPGVNDLFQMCLDVDNRDPEAVRELIEDFDCLLTAGDELY